MTTPRAEAIASQLAASDPAVSAFVAASAGSGKTRLLTERLLRLMVGGAKPEKILCLTFTKAAAAEMALRLHQRLGEWVTLDDDALAAALRALSIVPSRDRIERARSLFAQVLDLPGGMRIGTIHAFCQSLLRRFPLEAELSPHFQLADERDAEEVMVEAREDVLTRVRPRGPSNQRDAREQAVWRLAGAVKLDSFATLVREWRSGVSPRSGPVTMDFAAARRRVLGCTEPDRAAVIAAAVRWPGQELVLAAARVIAAGSKAKTAREKAEQALNWLTLTPSAREAAWDLWRGVFLTADGKPGSADRMVDKAVRNKWPDVQPVMIAEAERILAVEDSARAAECAAMSEALDVIAEPLLAEYEGRKSTAGLMEYDDLIDRGSALLVDPGADWVLYKLDGGLDHLLLDEVQDTAPEQWRIAHALTQEFFAGAGARETTRSVFAVGDRKQSIFSFQGADVAGFEAARADLRRRVEGAGMAWRDTPLNVSFRSTTAVLALVDAVFADQEAAKGVLLPGETMHHRADREGQPGVVELWPLTEAPKQDAARPWETADRYQRPMSPVRRLADELADWIRDQTSGGTMLASKARPLRPGDVMILVRQRRDPLARSLVRALKARDVPVAGLDRMVLTEEPAVQDLMALGEALLLPEDALTFATVLTSPLGGLNDDDLMELAIGRGKRPLWEALRARHEERPGWTEAWSFFSTLLNRADFVTPFALFAEILGPLGGRARLLARLGPEAAEPIDELLNAALRYAAAHPPSMQGFLHWLRGSGAEIKREAETGGDLVRILTVHGAKGLQAPLVILPDTTGMPRDPDPPLWARDAVSGRPVPIWVPRKEFACDVTRRIAGAAREKAREEYNRLLYVGLTRAEDRVLVCGVRKNRQVDPACWYSLIARGFDRLKTEPPALGRIVTDPVRDRVGFVTHATAPPERETVRRHAPIAAPPPSFLGTPPAPEPARPTPLAPSRPEGVELGPAAPSPSPLARIETDTDRFLRGQLIHSLLQHLPAVPAAGRAAAARGFLERSAHGLPAGAIGAIANEVLGILNHPWLAPLFGPGGRAEVPLNGVVADTVIGGLVDRLLVTDAAVRVVDFKTNRRAPKTVEETSIAYLRQMARYRAVLRIIFPGRPVECALIWTREARVMVLPDALLDAHEPAGTRSD